MATSTKITYTSIDQADLHLAHNAAWLALTEEVKARHLATAALWMNYSYEWPGKLSTCPIPFESLSIGFPYTYPTVYTATDISTTVQPAWPRLSLSGGPLLNCDGCQISGVPSEIILAQVYAAETSLTTELFAAAKSNDGQLKRKKIKAGPVEIDKEWAEESRGSTGEIELSRVTAVLLGFGVRRGTRTSAGPMVF